MNYNKGFSTFSDQQRSERLLQDKGKVRGQEGRGAAASGVVARGAANGTGDKLDRGLGHRGQGAHILQHSFRR